MRLAATAQDIYLHSEAANFLILLGKTHVIRLLYSLSNNNGPIRFNDLKRKIKVSATTLSRILVELEKFGLVHRKLYAEVPSRVEYEMTHSAREKLRPILEDLFEWIISNYSINSTKLK
jgi:DNA-binding HxlR family transcriptional regulator